MRNVLCKRNSTLSKLSPDLLHAVSIIRAADLVRDQRVDSGINMTLYDRGMEMDYLSIHAEPLWLVFLKSKLKKHLSGMI